MVGGDRRSPPRHKAKGGGSKGKGGGENEGLGAGFDGCVKSVGAKLTAKNGEEFHFGGCTVDGELQQVTDANGGLHDDTKLDEARCGTLKSLDDSTKVMEACGMQTEPHKPSSTSISCGFASWALEVDACEALKLNRECSGGVHGSVNALEYDSLPSGEVLRRTSHSPPLVRTKSSDLDVPVLLQVNSHDRCLRSRSTGMECDDLSQTPNGISQDAISASLECVNGSVDCWKTKKNGENDYAEGTVMQSHFNCTQGACSTASTKQGAVNAYVNFGFMNEGKSTTCHNSHPPMAAVNSLDCDTLEESKGVKNSALTNAWKEPTHGNVNSIAATGQYAVNAVNVVNAANAVNPYVKTGFMDKGKSVPSRITTSNGKQTYLSMQHQHVTQHWNSSMVPSRAAHATEVADADLNSKSTAVLNLPNVHPPNVWKRAGHMKVNIMELGTITNNGRSVSFDEVAYDRNKGRLENGLVGKLFGRKLPLHILDQELSRRWSYVGGFRTILLGGDCFLCIFETMVARDSILMGGPWQIMGQLIGMEKWSPEFNPELLTGFSSPVWVRLPKLPLLYWDNITIARIASMIGEPLWIDAQTTEWGRCEYARVCIRIDLSKSLPTGIWIQGKQTEFFQAVEYEGISLLCFHCGIIGHKAEVCRRKGMVTSTRNTANTKKTIVGANGEVMEGSNPSSTLGECSSADQLKSMDEPIQHAPNKSAIFVDQEDVKKYGPWILVSRKRKSQPKNGKKFPPTMTGKPAIPQTTHQTEFILERQQEQVPEIDEQHESNIDDSEALLSAQQMDVAAVEPVMTNDASLPSSNRKGKSRISKAHFEKELLQLGPIALKSRKRKKKVTIAEAEQCLKDFTQASNSGGGDASPSRGK